jgi:formylglycine-generating enzyme required for sulfatase activity
MVFVPSQAGTSGFFISRTEVPWELYDAFVYQTDAPAPNSAGSSGTPAADAVARPTKPYISMDRGFGHAGWPAISMSALNAVRFCEWLSAKSGRTYRLPTVAEWQRAAQVGNLNAARLLDHAWTAENSERTTHKVGTRAPDAAGLSDMFGNAAEWVTDASGAPCIMGGSFRNSAAECAAAQPIPNNSDWNASDPQFPKSVWWLADGGFIGVRVVCVQPSAE